MNEKNIYFYSERRNRNGMYIYIYISETGMQALKLTAAAIATHRCTPLDLLILICVSDGRPRHGINIVSYGK